MCWDEGSAVPNPLGEETKTARPCSSDEANEKGQAACLAGRVIRRLALVAVVGLSVLLPETAHANRGAPLGSGHVSLELSHLSFTDLRVSNGGYLALEGFGRIARRLYLGGEIGIGGNLAVLGDEAKVIPLEVNAKYVPFVARRLVVAVGVGAAICNVSYTDKDNLFGFIKIRKMEETLFGGQVFVDMAFAFDSFSAGISAKYQLTQDSGAGWDASTFRLGVHLSYVL